MNRLIRSAIVFFCICAAMVTGAQVYRAYQARPSDVSVHSVDDAPPALPLPSVEVQPAPAAPQPQVPTPAIPPTVNPLAPTDYESMLIDEINKQRVSHKLLPLWADDSLMRASRAWTLRMLNTGSLNHSNGNYGENIARGQHDYVDVVGSWMSNPGHRANILGSDYIKIGVGCYSGPGGPWWCAEFK